MRVLPSIDPGELLRALACAAIGVLGALPLEGRGPAPVGLLVWLALCAAPVGALAGGQRMHAWVVAPVIPAVWAVALVAVDALSARDLPAPAWGALAWTGLFAFGFGCGRACAGRAASFALPGALLIAVALASVAPAGGLVLAEPWPPALAARLFDLSPATLVVECAGVDWLRHPALYAPAGAADVGPTLRAAYQGVLAAPPVLVVGSLVALGGDALARRRAPGHRPARTNPGD